MEHEASTSLSFKDHKLVIMKPNEFIIINLAISLKGEAEHIYELKAVQILAPGKALKLFTSNSLDGANLPRVFNTQKSVYQLHA